MRLWLAASLVLMSAEVARADEPARVNISATVASDYISRGFSRSNGHASVGLGADLTKSAFYAGTWVSTLGGLDAADTEVLAYGGWRPERWGYSFDLGIVGRAYPGGDRKLADPNLEVQASVSQTLGPLQYGGRAIYTPKARNIPGAARIAPSEAGEGYYLELNAAYELTRGFKASAAVGRQGNTYDVLDPLGRARPASYTTWNLGVGYDLARHLSLDVRYWDTDAHGLGSSYRPRLVGSLTASF